MLLSLQLKAGDELIYPFKIDLLSGGSSLNLGCFGEHFGVSDAELNFCLPHILYLLRILFRLLLYILLDPLALCDSNVLILPELFILKEHRKVSV